MLLHSPLERYPLDYMSLTEIPQDITHFAYTPKYCRLFAHDK